MAKRYAYWRQPDGKPYRGVDGKYAPTALLAEVGQTAQITAEGNISWSMSSGLGEYRPAIFSNLAILDAEGNELNAKDTVRLAWQSLTSIIKNKGGGQSVEPSELYHDVNIRAAAHFRQPVKKYVFISSLSIKEFPARRIMIHGCQVEGLSKRGCRYPYPEHVRDIPNNSFLWQHVNSTQYKTIKVKTQGRSTYEAVDAALDAVNYLRGLWTLFATFRARSFHYGTPLRNPIGAIYIGPIHTLHQPGGGHADDMYWYEPDYVEDRDLFVPKTSWKEIEKHRRDACRKIRYLS